MQSTSTQSLQVLMSSPQDNNSSQPLQPRIKISSKVQLTSNNPLTLYNVRFDCLDYDIQLPYPTGMDDAAVMVDLEKVYWQIKATQQ